MAVIRPWGLSRLAPFATASPVPAYTMRLDPETQTGLCILEDGTVVTARHRKTGTNKETSTSRSKGDGKGPQQYDPDKDQDGDED